MLHLLHSEVRVRTRTSAFITGTLFNSLKHLKMVNFHRTADRSRAVKSSNFILNEPLVLAFMRQRAGAERGVLILNKVEIESRITVA